MSLTSQGHLKDDLLHTVLRNKCTSCVNIHSYRRGISFFLSLLVFQLLVAVVVDLGLLLKVLLDLLAVGVDIGDSRQRLHGVAAGNDPRVTEHVNGSVALSLVHNQQAANQVFSSCKITNTSNLSSLFVVKFKVRTATSAAIESSV